MTFEVSGNWAKFTYIHTIQPLSHKFKYHVGNNKTSKICNKLHKIGIFFNYFSELQNNLYLYKAVSLKDVNVKQLHKIILKPQKFIWNSDNE